MANVYEPTEEQKSQRAKWVAERPDAVRAVAERFQPWKLYRMRSTGHRVTVHSYGEGENGSVTLTVNVTGKYNLLAFERRVFGIDPDDLSECDLPGADEPVGSADLSIEDAARLAGMPPRGAAN